MPLRRFLPFAAAVCLLVVTMGASGPHLAAPRRAAAPLPAAAVPLPTPAALLRAAQPYLVPAATLPGGSGVFPGEGAVQLYHLRYEQVMPNGLSAMVVQRVFQIRNQAAADLFVLDDLWYDSARTRFQLQNAQVLRRAPDGVYQPVLEGKDLGDLRPGATGNQPRRIGLPVLRAGDRVSLLYLLLPNTAQDWSLLQGHFLGNLFAFRDSYPSLRVRYVLSAATPVAVNQLGVPPPQRGQGLDGNRTWSWEAGNQPAFFSLPDGPSITDRSPFVQVSGFHSWAGMANWYSALLARRAQMAPDFERRLLRVAAPAVPPAGAGIAGPDQAAIRATVARVWSYLGAHLDYQGNESGIHAYVPAPVAQVFAAQRGDCKDGALLLTTWLRAAGIEADLALVRTAAMGRLAPPAAGGEVAATMAAFDHALVYIPSTQQWIDTTAPGFLEGELPSSDQNSLALIVRGGQSELVRIPSAAPADNLTQRTIRLSPAADGWLRAEGDIAVRGADAPDLRRRYADPRSWRADLRSWLLDYFSGARVETVAVAGVTPPADTVRLHFVALLPAQSFTVAWIRRQYARLLAAEVQRQQPLELPLRWQLDESWSLALDGAGACGRLALPPPLSRAGPFGQLAIATTCSQGELQVHSQILQAAQTVPPADYNAFRAFWQSVDTALDASVPTPLPIRQPVVAAASR